MQPELQSAGTGYDNVAVAPDSQKVLRNTYLLLALTMVPTVVGAWIGMQTAWILQGSPFIGFVLMLGSIIGLQYGIAHFRNSVIGIGLLLLMTGLLGWFIGPLLNHALSVKNGADLVGYSAAGTGAVFFGMATIATVTKRDFGFMGKFLFAGMIALLVAMVANMFMQIPVLSLVISSLVIVVFSLYLLYDLSRIVTGGETNYVMATTGVYISLLNIFTSLLSILTGNRD
ncbi:MAG: Bax inhibitor-1/YccA family protein [Betaproteobacteria bacterium]